MGFLKSGTTEQGDALTGFDSAELDVYSEQARGATLARRKTLVARMPLPEGAGVGDVAFWSAAVHRVQMHGWSLVGWSVVAEPSGTVAYAAFTA